MLGEILRWNIISCKNNWLSNGINSFIFLQRRNVLCFFMSGNYNNGEKSNPMRLHKCTTLRKIAWTHIWIEFFSEFSQSEARNFSFKWIEAFSFGSCYLLISFENCKTSSNKEKILKPFEFSWMVSENKKKEKFNFRFFSSSFSKDRKCKSFHDN